jgi:hypothetical protein
MQRGLDPVCGKKIAQITTFSRAVPSARCASAPEVMRDNEVQSRPVIAKFKEGAVLFAMATVLQRY